MPDSASARLQIGCTEPRAQGNDQLERAADAQNHAHPLAIEITVPAIARVGKRLLGNQQAEKLRRVSRLDRMRGDPEIQRRKINRREKPAPPAVGAVACLRVRIVIVAGSPVGLGHFGDGIDAIEDIGPVPLEVLCSRKHAAHPDDGHRYRGRRSERIQVFTLSSVAMVTGKILTGPVASMKVLC